MGSVVCEFHFRYKKRLSVRELITTESPRLRNPVAALTMALKPKPPTPTKKGAAPTSPHCIFRGNSDTLSSSGKPRFSGNSFTENEM